MAKLKLALRNKMPLTSRRKSTDKLPLFSILSSLLSSVRGLERVEKKKKPAKSGYKWTLVAAREEEVWAKRI